MLFGAVVNTVILSPLAFPSDTNTPAAALSFVRVAVLMSGPLPSWVIDIEVNVLFTTVALRTPLLGNEARSLTVSAPPLWTPKIVRGGVGAGADAEGQVRPGRRDR